MKRLLPLSLLLTLPGWGMVSAPEAPAERPPVETVQAQQCPTISDPIGRAGMLALEMPMEYGGSQIFMAGGANFPKAKRSATGLTELGPKVYYDTIEVLSPTLGGHYGVGKLPQPLGYAAYGLMKDGIAIAGGCNASGHLNKAYLLRYTRSKFVAEALPDLPVSIAFPAFTMCNGKLYVFGGQESPDAATALKRCFVLEDGATAWKELAPMPDDGRLLAGAGALNGKIYITGGCSLHPDAEGKGERTYLNTTLVYDPATDSWSTAADLPETLVGMATPLPAVNGKLYVVGGDPGNYYRAKLAGQEPAHHPGQNRTVYAYDAAADSWQPVGENSMGVATAPAVLVGKTIYTVSGETAPTIRTSVISTIKLNNDDRVPSSSPLK